MIIIPIKWLFQWEYTLFSDKRKWAAFKGLPTCWLYMRFPLQYLGDGHNPLWEFLWRNWMEDRGLQVQGVKASRWSDTQLSHTPADPKRLSSPLGPVTSRCEPWRMMSRHGPGATALLDPVPAGRKPRMWPGDAERNQRLVKNPVTILPPMPNKLQVVKEVQISFNLLYLIGWWFGTFYTVPYIGNFIIPFDFHIFQRGRYTTNQLSLTVSYGRWFMPL